MAQSLSKIYLHITFSTKNRHPFIDDTIMQDLWEFLGGICRALECNPIRIGGHNDHVHICCLLSKKVTPVKLLGELKSVSSKWIKTKGKRYDDFYWQDGYGAFSVSPSAIDKVVEYIDNQYEHHKQRTFKEELLVFLKQYGVEYDERYLWE